MQTLCERPLNIGIVTMSTVTVYIALLNITNDWGFITISIAVAVSNLSRGSQRWHSFLLTEFILVHFVALNLRSNSSSSLPLSTRCASYFVSLLYSLYCIVLYCIVCFKCFKCI